MRLRPTGGRHGRHGAGRRSGWLATAACATATAAVVAAVAVQFMSRQAERRYPPRGRFVDVDGVRVHYVEQGRGDRTIVILHGMGALIDDFAISGVPDLLARRNRVITIDRPGYGYSERPRGKVWTPAEQAELLRKAVRLMGVDRAVVVGHSWGTLSAVALGLEYPEFVEGLVLISGYYFPTERPDVPSLETLRVPVLGDILRYTTAPLVGRVLARPLLKLLFAPRGITRSFRERFPLGLTLRPGHLRASADDVAALIPATRDLQRRYTELHMPVVIVAGDSDRLVSTPQQSLRLARMLPQAELRVFRGEGHMPHHYVPEQIAAAIGNCGQPAARAGAVPAGGEQR